MGEHHGTEAPNWAPVMVRLRPEVKQWLRNHAARNGVSMAMVLSDLVIREMELATALEAENASEDQRFAKYLRVTGEHPAIEDRSAFDADRPFG